MKKRQYALLFIAVLLASLIVGCIRNTEAVTDHIDLVPETANMIGRVELSQIIGDGDIAEIYTALPKEEGDPQTIEEALARVMDMSNLDLRDFEEGWIFSDISQATEDEDYSGAILKGTFEESSLLASMESAMGEGFASIDYLGHTIYTGSGQQDGLAILTSDLLVTGSVQAIKDVIAVSEGTLPAVGGDLLTTYNGLGHALVKVAAAVPSGLVEQRLQELTTGISSPPALNALADVQIVGMTMAKNGQSIACNSQFFFSDSQSANDVKGLIPLLSLVIGSIEMPEGSVIQNPEKALALLPELLAKCDFHTTGSCLTISSDLTAADVAAMSTAAGPSGLAIAMSVNMGSLTSSGLGVSIDATISNHIGLKFDVGDLRLAATSEDGRTYIEEYVAGSSIPANSTARFQDDIVIPLELVGERGMLIVINTTAEARGLSMPLSASVALTTLGIDSLIVVPEIDLEVDFGELTSDGLHMGLQANLSNSNPFGIDMGDLQIVAEGQSGNVIFTSAMQGCPVGPDSTGMLSGDLLMPLEVLNEPAIVMTVQTQAGFAGVTLPITARVTVNMPDLESLITIPEIDLGVDFGEPTSDGLRMGLQTAITNSNAFGIDVGDLQIVAEGQSGNVILTSNMNGCSIGPDSTGTLSGDLLMPLEVLNEATIVITVQTQAGFAGVTLPINARVMVNMLGLESITVPEIDLGVDFGELTSDGLHMGLRTTITNSNAFGIDVGDLQIVAEGQSGNVILTSNMKGCSIGPDSTGTLSGDLLMPLEVLNEATIVITVQTQAGFAGVTLPINAKVTVKMPDIESLITVPEIDLGVDFGELTSDGLHIGLQANLSNSNPFGIDVGDLQILAKGQSGNVIFSSNMKGCSIGPDSTGTLSGDLLMPLEVLNEPSIVITVQTQAGFAGVTLPINAKVTVKMPDLESLFTVPRIEMYTKPSLVSGFPLPGLHVVVASTITNNGNIDLIVNDNQVTFFDSDGELVEGMTVPGGTIAAHSRQEFSGSVTLSSSQYLSLISGDYFRVEVATAASIRGVDATIPIEAAMTMVLASLFEFPGVGFGVDFGELTSDGLHMGLQTDLSNSNPFGINVDDLLIVVKGQSGNVILTSNVKGCSIGPDSTGTLPVDLLMPLEVLNEPTIVITIQTQTGFAGVTQPINAKVTVNMPDIESLITVPDIDLGVDFGELTSDGLHMRLQTNLANSNPFGIDVGDLQVVVKDQSGNVILTSNVKGCSIGSDSTGTLSVDLLMPLEVLNEPTIVITIQTQAGFAEVTLPINANVVLVNMPDVDGVIWGSHDTPSAMEAGQTYVVSINITNHSSFTWLCGGSNPVHLAYHWYTSDGYLVEWDGGRSVLSSDVASGGSTTLSAIVTAPSSPGSYILKWDLVHEGVIWFSTAGCSALDIEICVAG